MRIATRVGSPGEPVTLDRRLPRVHGQDDLVETAKRRISRMGTDDLYEWVDTQVAAVGRSVSDMRKGEDGDGRSPAGDAVLGVATLALAVEELARRASD